ncbi:enoyl-CoA hydratase/isomerase family protein [Labrys wisconsinensis]|uniref:Enoyl-CoA hydratase/carnithine racemase n=1 Tax=Labrys wisconsinensis TaxID=425677 RepID=A0ABU0JIM4_9HYPH|nr:enoyl-CoA hydratase/isomerase family protein [Labrys wisconsinensis]MDQ0474129.1 enoyl-CoA hydratase/carnithine racemase [Labrys wisconsinensis]
MSLIALSFDGPLALLRLDRPAKLNALTPDMLAEIEAAVARVEAEPAARCLVLSGAGKAFSVGADINIWSELSLEAFRASWVVGGHRAFDRLARCRLPVVAALHGMAFGGGLELALAADLRVAESGTLLALPEASLGTVPGWGGTQRLPELIGIPRAKQMILTAGRVDAAAAEQWGLVNQVAPAGEGLAAARALALEIAAMAPVSVQIAKTLVDARHGQGLGATLETLAGVATAATADVKEGIAALRARRRPVFEGR